MRARSALPGLAALAFGLLAPSAWAGEPLRFCLDQSSLTASPGDGKSDHAFDVRVADMVARRLGRTAMIQWYQSASDSDSNPDDQMNALLSDGRCDLVLGYPLLASALRHPLTERARLPGFDGSRPEDRRRWVKLNELRASRGYRFEPIAVVLGPTASDLGVHRLSDLKGLRLAAEGGTMTDAILMSYDGGVLIPNVIHVDRGDDLFAGMERGEYGATLVELPRFDAYVSRHPGTRLVSSGYYHSIGFNVGVVGLAAEAALLDRVDDAIAASLASDELAAMAGASHVTYLPPREPNIRPTINAAELRKD